MINDDSMLSKQPIEHAGTKIDSMMGASTAAGARDTAASAIDGAARKIHQGADSLSHLAHDAGARLDDTARYVREHDAEQMLDDMRTMVRAHPGKSLVAALAVGLLVGRAFRS